MKNAAIIGGLCIVAIAVGGYLYFHPTPSSQVASSAAATPVEVAFSVLDEGPNGGSDVRKNYAIYDAKEFKRFWDKAHTASTTPPKIDFTKEYVLLLFDGTQPTGGYTIAASQITDTPSGRAVTVTRTVPGASCVVTQAATSPYQFISVPIGPSDSLSHEDVTVTTECK
jgi:hypothetical protein